jgi:hypothetical protein
MQARVATQHFQPLPWSNGLAGAEHSGANVGKGSRAVLETGYKALEFDHEARSQRLLLDPRLRARACTHF